MLSIYLNFHQKSGSVWL